MKSGRNACDCRWPWQWVFCLLILPDAVWAGDPSGDASVKRLRRSPIILEPLVVRELDSLDVPGKLLEDERELVGQGTDLPVVLLRCADKPDAVWTLRLPEFGILGNEGIGRYQTAYAWQRDGEHAVFYDWHPLTSPILKGRVKARAEVRPEGHVEFSVTLRNDSERVWTLPSVWVCLIHRYAGDGASYYVNADQRMPTAGVPDPESIWLKWFTVRGHEDYADACRKWVGYKIRPGTAEQPRLVWEAADTPGFEVRIGSEEAALLGWSKWPCTDMAIRGPDIPPGGDHEFKGYVEMGRE